VDPLAGKAPAMAGADLHGVPTPPVTAASVKGPLHRPSAARDPGSWGQKAQHVALPYRKRHSSATCWLFWPLCGSA